MSDLFVCMSLMASNGSKPVYSMNRRRRNLCEIGAPLISMALQLLAHVHDAEIEMGEGPEPPTRNDPAQ
jgi:hypothetical protein